MCQKEGFSGKSGRVGHKKRRNEQEPWKKMKLIKTDTHREGGGEEKKRRVGRDEREESRRGGKEKGRWQEEAEILRQVTFR